MIPKTIHYCWFGGSPLPEFALKCIASWKKYLPEYEIKEWNENNFNVNKIPYIKEAYTERKFAFVSDYARFYILYQFGGLYFDTDVELIKPLKPLIDKGAFMGCEHTTKENLSTLGVNPGLGFGVPPKLSILKEILDFYEKQHFILQNGRRNPMTIVDITTYFLQKYGLKYIDGIQSIAGINIYPKEYLCPKDFETGVLQITNNTYSIHHFDFSWASSNVKKAYKLRGLVKRYLGNNIVNIGDKYICFLSKCTFLRKLFKLFK